MAAFRAGNPSVGRVVNPFNTMADGSRELGNAFGNLRTRTDELNDRKTLAADRLQTIGRENTERDILSNINQRDGFNLGVKTMDYVNNEYNKLTNEYDAFNKKLKHARANQQENMIVSYDENGNPIQTSEKMTLDEAEKYNAERYDKRLNILNEQVLNQYNKDNEVFNRVADPADQQERLKQYMIKQGLTTDRAKTLSTEILKPYMPTDISERQKLMNEALNDQRDAILEGGTTVTNESGTGRPYSSTKNNTSTKYSSIKTIDAAAKKWAGYDKPEERDGFFSFGDTESDVGKMFRSVTKTAKKQNIDITPAELALAADQMTVGRDGKLLSLDRRISEKDIYKRVLQNRADGTYRKYSGSNQPYSTRSTQSKVYSKKEQKALERIAKQQRDLLGSGSNVKASDGFEEMHKLNRSHYLFDEPKEVKKPVIKKKPKVKKEEVKEPVVKPIKKEIKKEAEEVIQNHNDVNKELIEDRNKYYEYMKKMNKTTRANKHAFYKSMMRKLKNKWGDELVLGNREDKMRSRELMEQVGKDNSGKQWFKTMDNKPMVDNIKTKQERDVLRARRHDKYAKKAGELFGPEYKPFDVTKLDKNISEQIKDIDNTDISDDEKISQIMKKLKTSRRVALNALNLSRQRK